MTDVMAQMYLQPIGNNHSCQQMSANEAVKAIRHRTYEITDDDDIRPLFYYMSPVESFVKNEFLSGTNFYHPVEEKTEIYGEIFEQLACFQKIEKKARQMTDQLNKHAIAFR